MLNDAPRNSSTNPIRTSDIQTFASLTQENASKRSEVPANLFCRGSWKFKAQPLIYRDGTGSKSEPRGEAPRLAQSDLYGENEGFSELLHSFCSSWKELPDFVRPFPLTVLSAQAVSIPELAYKGAPSSPKVATVQLPPKGQKL